MSLYYLALNNNQKTYILKITNFTFIMRTPPHQNFTDISQPFLSNQLQKILPLRYRSKKVNLYPRGYK